MKFRVSKIGKVSLPRGMSTRAITKVNILPDRQVVQSEPEWMSEVTDIAKQTFRMSDIIQEVTDICVLGYRDVETHTDDYMQVRYNKQWVAPGFLHVVVSGKATITVGTKKLPFKRGDVFLMNPNAPHSVKLQSRRPCVSVCFVVPLYALAHLVHPTVSKSLPL